MEEAIRYIPVAGRPAHLKTVQEIEALLDARIDEKLIKKRRGTGGEYDYVPWETTLKILNDVFGVFGWGSTNPLTYYTEGGRTFVVVKSLTISAYDPGSSCIVLVTKTNSGRSQMAGENSDTAVAGADSDALSRAAKLLGNALGSFLYAPNDPAHQSSQTRTGGYANTSSQSSSSGRDRPTANMIAALQRYKVPESTISRLNFKQAGDMIGTFKAGGSMDNALAVAGVGPVAVAEADEIPF